jgi:hypothetical protein
MVCENCKHQDASVHITEINHATSQQIQRHFCPACADLFQQSDILQQAFGRLQMMTLRVTATSADRTVVNVLGGRHDGETWSLITDRLRQLQIQPFDGLEFELEEDRAYLDWLSGEEAAL